MIGRSDSQTNCGDVVKMSEVQLEYRRRNPKSMPRASMNIFSHVGFVVACSEVVDDQEAARLPPRCERRGPVWLVMQKRLWSADLLRVVVHVPKAR